MAGEYIKRVVQVGLGIIFILSIIQVAPFEMTSKTVKAEGPGTDDWFMFRHDMNRTGNTTSRAPNTNNILWTHQIPPTGYTWGYCGSPAVAQGYVYQGGQRPDGLRAFDTVTGIQEWVYVPAPSERITCSPTVVNDHVFFTAYNDKAYCLTREGLNWVWERQLNFDADSSPTVYDGKVYIGEGRGDYVPDRASLLYSLDETNGNFIWTFQAGGQIISSPTIVDDKVIFGSYDKNVYALPAEDPSPGDNSIDVSEAIWIFNAGARVVSSVAVEDGVVYIGALNGKLYALPLTDPNGDGTISSDEVIWEFATGNEIWSSAGIANGRIFIGSHDYHIYALPKQDPNGDGVISANEIIWKFRTTDKVWSSPSIAGGKVFIASEDYTLWALCEETGELIWNYIMPLQTEPFGSELLYSTPAIVDGRIYIGNYDLTMYCFGNDLDITPPVVTNVMPTNNSVDVPLNSNIEIGFDETLCDALITGSSITVQSSSGKYSTGQIIYDNATSTLLFNPNEDFLPNERYIVRLRSRYLQDYAGNALDGNHNGVLDLSPQDDYIWYFNTSELVGHKPKVEDASVTPQQGYLNSNFEFYVTYTDEDGDPPTEPMGYIEVFIDDSPEGVKMEWANGTNTPYFHLLDRDYTNGELFRLRTQVYSVGGHKFYIECSDGSNTNRTPEYLLPAVLNAPPELEIPTQYVNEDEEYLLNLSLYVNDIDNDTTTLSFGEGSDYCEIVDNHLMSCLFTAEDMLSEIVNISVSDGINLVWQDVLFIINPVNDPPMLKPGIIELPLVSVYEDSVYEFDLKEYVTDPDTPIELLQVSFDSANITFSGLILYLLYSEPYTYENVSLTITDGTGTLVLFLEVNALPVNNPPVIDVPPLVLTEDVTTSLDLGQYITDEESQISELELKVISEALGEIELSGTELALCYPEGTIEDYLNITAIDGDVETSQKVRITILPVNDAPSLHTPRAERVSEVNRTAYNFLVRYIDEDLMTDRDQEPAVELVLNDEVYPLVMLEKKDPIERLYGITLELEEGTYHYHFECDDCAGEANSHAGTSVKTLKVSGGESGDEGDEESTSGWDIFPLCLFGFLFIIIVIIVLILINVWMLFSRREQGQYPETRPQEIPPPVVEEEVKTYEEEEPAPPEDEEEPLPSDDEEEPSPPKDWEEEPPPEDEEIPEDELPSPDDEEEPPPPEDWEEEPPPEDEEIPQDEPPYPEDEEMLENELPFPDDEEEPPPPEDWEEEPPVPEDEEITQDEPLYPEDEEMLGNGLSSPDDEEEPPPPKDWEEEPRVPEDEEIPQDELPPLDEEKLPPSEDWEEESPVPEDEEIPEDEIPSPEDEDEPPPPDDWELQPPENEKLFARGGDVG